jgi:hypothetical protein
MWHFCTALYCQHSLRCPYANFCYPYSLLYLCFIWEVFILLKECPFAFSVHPLKHVCYWWSLFFLCKCLYFTSVFKEYLQCVSLVFTSFTVMCFGVHGPFQICDLISITLRKFLTCISSSITFIISFSLFLGLWVLFHSVQWASCVLVFVSILLYLCAVVYILLFTILEFSIHLCLIC